MAAARPFYSQVFPRSASPTEPTPVDVDASRWINQRTRNADNAHSAFFKNNFNMLGFVFATGFAFELGFNGAMNKYWDYLNRGRQWKDIRHKYVEAAEEDDE